MAHSVEYGILLEALSLLSDKETAALKRTFADDTDSSRLLAEALETSRRRETERGVLLETLKLLSDKDITALKRTFAGDMERYLSLTEALKRTRQPGDAPGGVREDWRAFSQEGDKFTQLMEQYIEEYQEREKRKGLRGNLSDLEASVNNHSKWRRMMNAHGIGKAYRDDMRRVCVVFGLNYRQATELLWAAGQPFDTADKRDFIIAQCLTEGRWTPEEVNRALESENVPALFHQD